jgi:CRP-like cAMP-binding protein
LFIVTDGEADVIDNRDGKEVVIGTLGHGKVFGEHGLAVPGAVHDKTIRARTELTVIAMDEATFAHIEAASHKPAPEPATSTTRPAPAV